MDAVGRSRVESCIITDNAADMGGGLLCYGREPSTSTHCTFARWAPEGSGLAFSADIHMGINYFPSGVLKYVYVPLAVEHLGADQGHVPRLSPR